MPDDAERRAEESLRSIEAGGLPLAAQERLAELRRAGGRFFTSDLAVPEFLLVREAGFRPLTQVMGSCFYHVGWQSRPYGYRSGGRYREGETLELETQTRAWNEARELALGRLAEEARLADADAVVGVRIKRRAYNWAAGTIELTAVGTAVVSEEYDFEERPLLSALSGQEVAGLVANGWMPVGVAAHTVVAYVMTSLETSQALASPTFGGTGRTNQELREMTDGLYDVRDRAVAALVHQRAELRATGIVGLQYDQNVERVEAERYDTRRTDLIVTLHVLGTAIVELAIDEEPPVYIALPLS